MATQTNNTDQFNSLSTASRVARVAVATTFIGVVMTTSGPIGGLAILPLLSVYLVATAIASWDPVNALFSYGRNRAGSLNVTADNHSQAV